MGRLVTSLLSRAAPEAIEAAADWTEDPAGVMCV